MAAFCLIPEKVQQFKQALKDGTINPEKLSTMTSEERNKFLKNIVGEDNATQVNSLFESKLLLKNQKAGMISWAKKVSGLTPEAKRDLMSKIEKLDKVLNPEDEKMFLRDLASTKLGTNVSPTEAKTIFDLSKKVQEAKANMGDDLTFKTDAERLAYGRAKVALSNYVNDIKEVNSKLTLKERMNPTNYLRNLSDIAGNAKSIKASMDNSAIFRQGWKSMWTNPLIWQKNARQTFVDIVKTFGGKKVMDEINADIISRPNYERYAKAKLAIGTIEEAFPGTIAEKLPLVGRAYKASETAYTGFLYRQRADIFDKYLDIAKRSGINIDDASELKPIASLVNSLTGRGNLGKYEGSAANFANNVFFSPRFVKSQFDTLGHVFTGAGGSNFVRKQAAQNLLKIVMGTAATLAISDVVKPGSVQWDPRSSDFGKIKIGNTRFDVTGGASSLVTLASRILPILVGQEGQTKSTTTGEVTPINSGKYGASTGKDVLFDFLSNKASPVAGIFLNLLKGKDFDGNKTTLGGELVNAFTPIGFSTYQDLAKDPNSPNKVITMILDGLGIGANTYLPKPTKENSWTESPTKSQEAFKNKVGEAKFKDANAMFNHRYETWLKEVENNETYKKLDNDKKNGVNKSARERIQDQVFKEFGFTYQESKKTREDLRQEQELEKIKPKKVSKSLMDMLIPTASADEGLGGSSTYSFRDGEKSVNKVDEGIITKILKAVSSIFGNNKDTSGKPTRINDVEITTRETDGFPFPDYTNSAPGQTLRADLNYTNTSKSKKDVEFVLHLQSPDGELLEIPQTKEGIEPGQKQHYGLETKIPKDAKVGDWTIWATANGQEISGSRKKHRIVQEEPIDRYSDEVRKTSKSPTLDRGTINDFSKMKLTVSVGDKFVNEQKGGSGDVPELKATPPSKGNWKSKHEDVWNKVLGSKGIDKTVGTLIARSENGKEIANYANLNHGNMAGTFDIGLTQVNIVPPPEIKSKIIADTKNMSQAEANVYINKLIDDGVITGEAEKLRNPEYAINKAAELYEARLKNLGDPVLAIASYNLGSGGAVLSPKKALDRAKYVYNNAGLELPKTPFTEDPEGFVEKNMDKYKSIGLIRR